MLKNPPLTQGLRDELALLLVLAVTVLPHGVALPLVCSGLVVLALLMRGAIVFGAMAAPSKFLPLGMLALGLLAIRWQFQSFFGTEAGVALVVLLLALKTLEMRGTRDVLVVFFLGFFTILTQFLHAQTLPGLVLMLAGAWGLLTVVVRAHMPGPATTVRQAAAVALRLTAWGVPVMAVLFVVFPRVGPLWGVPEDKGIGRTGLSDTMALGSMSELTNNPAIALRLRFEDEAPDPSHMYLRAHVFGHFDGRQWSSLAPDLPSPSHAARDLRVQGRPLRYEVTLEPHHTHWLPVLESSPLAPVGEGLHTSPGADLRWLSMQAVDEPLRYQAQSYTQFRYGSSLSAQDLQAWTLLPPGYNPRTLQWAALLRSDPALRDTDAQTLSQWLLRQLHQDGYRYTLAPGSYGRNSVDEFWFDRKAGFCEHFAAAYVVMMRAMGVPARVVTGYQGAERNPIDGLWTVRHSDAHAWAEFWQSGLGWIHVDPTAAVAPSRIEGTSRLAASDTTAPLRAGAGSGRLWLPLRQGWEAANYRWNVWVTGYDQRRQMQLLSDLGISGPQWEDLAWLLGAVIALAIAALGGWNWRQNRRQSPWQRLRTAADRELATLGLAPQAHHTPRQLAALLAQRFGPASAPMGQWLLALEKAHYGANPAAPDWRQLLHSLRRLPWANLRQTKAMAT
jgi:transglutaminase-like putative cysteine protease